MRPRMMRARTSASSRLSAFAPTHRRGRAFGWRFRPAHGHGGVEGLRQRRSRRGIIRIEFDRSPEEPRASHCWRAMAAAGPAARVARSRRLPDCRSAWRRPPLLDLGDANGQSAGDLGGDLVLQGEQVGQASSNRGRPQHPAVVVDELRIHPHALAGLADAALDLVADRERCGRCRRGCGPVLVWKDRVPRHTVSSENRPRALMMSWVSPSAKYSRVRGRRSD